MNKIELLIPVGNEENLKVAVENGADAVYLGIDKFNARRRADNFKLSELRKTVDYCHKNGVKVYITLNILIKNSELEDFFKTIGKVYLSGVDAVIIQQLSFLPIIKKNFPGLEVHVSTQAAISNTYFYDLIKQADKVVLPREFSKEEIQNFIDKTKLPTEIFVQGALCFAYSGKCLFSSFLGGRSGNRGLCAQPCRKKYNKKYLLSMKDLCLVKDIPNLIGMGVASLKVEGRLRSKNYVASTTKLYRTAIDSYYSGKFQVDADLFREMKLAFNREFTWGYYAELKDVVSNERPTGRGLYLGEINLQGKIKLEEDVSIGDGVGIWLPKKVDGAVLTKIELNNVVVETASKGDLVNLNIRAKPGTKIYKTSSVEKTKEISFVKNKPIVVKERKLARLELPEIKEEEGKEELLVKVYSVGDGEIALRYSDKVFYDIFAEDFNNQFSAYVPRLLNDSGVDLVLKLIKKHDVKNILVGDLGAYSELKKEKLNLYLDYSNNLFNNYDLEYFGKGVISPELSFKELQEFKNKEFSVLVHGRVVMMNTKYEHLPPKLKDDKRYTFPVRQEHSCYQILNSKELGLFDLVLKLKKVGIKSFFLDLDHGVEKTLDRYNKILLGKDVELNKFDFTKGHFDKGVE
jgi:collagenase-like PrtC family protease